MRVGSSSELAIEPTAGVSTVPTIMQNVRTSADNHRAQRRCRVPKHRRACAIEDKAIP